MDTQITGSMGEDTAKAYLLKQGLEFIEANYYSKGGEIDLIMRDGEHLVFVEVRLRFNPSYGSSLETITAVKQSKIIHTAKCFLLENGLYDKVDCRFDAIGIGPDMELTWIPNAFEETC